MAPPTGLGSFDGTVNRTEVIQWPPDGLGSIDGAQQDWGQLMAPKQDWGQLMAPKQDWGQLVAPPTGLESSNGSPHGGRGHSVAPPHESAAVIRLHFTRRTAGSSPCH